MRHIQCIRFISDILRTDGNILNFYEFQLIYGIKTHFLDFESLKLYDKVKNETQMTGQHKHL